MAFWVGTVGIVQQYNRANRLIQAYGVFDCIHVFRSSAEHVRQIPLYEMIFKRSQIHDSSHYMIKRLLNADALEHTEDGQDPEQTNKSKSMYETK